MSKPPTASSHSELWEPSADTKRIASKLKVSLHGLNPFEAVWEAIGALSNEQIKTNSAVKDLVKRSETIKADLSRLTKRVATISSSLP